VWLRLGLLDGRCFSSLVRGCSPLCRAILIEDVEDAHHHYHIDPAGAETPPACTLQCLSFQQAIGNVTGRNKEERGEERLDTVQRRGILGEA
jgi:hypothetical protein